MAFANAEAVLILARWLRRWRFHPAPGAKVEVSWKVTLQPKGGLPAQERSLMQTLGKSALGDGPKSFNGAASQRQLPKRGGWIACGKPQGGYRCCMYVPEQFAVGEESEIAEILRHAPLGCLVTHGSRGLFATHIPFVHDRESGVLAGHLSRANPHRNEAGEEEALVIFQGVSAYISPTWYPSKAAHGRVVPTWNYEVVHVYGRIMWREERDWLLANVTALTERFEAVRSTPWAVTDAPSDHVERLIGGIVGLELRISRIEAKRKLSQNRPERDRQGVIFGLRASGSPKDWAMAEVMQSQRSK